MKASKTLVCIVGESHVDFGMLKAKVSAIDAKCVCIGLQSCNDHGVMHQVDALVAKLEPPLNQAPLIQID